MNAVPRGRLITIEGIEGAGKSTQVKAVCKTLEARGIAVTATREPGGTALGEALRDLLLSHVNDGITAESELLLMFAARAEHITTVVRPALESGRWVVSDRFTDASYAYQGGGRGCNRAMLDSLRRSVCTDIEPDLTFLLDISPGKAAARVETRGAKDRFESESPEFFERVRRAYLALAGEQPERWRIIPAHDGAEQIETFIGHEIKAFLNTPGVSA